MAAKTGGSSQTERNSGAQKIDFPVHDFIKTASRSFNCEKVKNL